MALEITDEAGMRRVQKTVTIRRSREELYGFWRNVVQLPTFMKHLQSVTVIDEYRSHWVAEELAGELVEWYVDIIDDRENERITWQSLPEGPVHHGGTVRFTEAPAGRGTEVCVTLNYDPPTGMMGATLARFFDEHPSQRLDEDLYGFKQLMETGRIVTTKGQTHGER